MLTEALFTVGKWLLSAIFSLLDLLPDFPASLVTSLNGFFSLIFGNLSVLGFFVPISTLKVLIPLTIAVIKFEDIYAFVLWIIKKIPFIGVK